MSKDIKLFENLLIETVTEFMTDNLLKGGLLQVRLDSFELPYGNYFRTFYNIGIISNTPHDPEYLLALSPKLRDHIEQSGFNLERIVDFLFLIPKTDRTGGYTHYNYMDNTSITNLFQCEKYLERLGKTLVNTYFRTMLIGHVNDSWLEDYLDITVFSYISSSGSHVSLTLRTLFDNSVKHTKLFPYLDRTKSDAELNLIYVCGILLSKIHDGLPPFDFSERYVHISNFCCLVDLKLELKSFESNMYPSQILNPADYLQDLEIEQAYVLHKQEEEEESKPKGFFSKLFNSFRR